jgi:hypothetical protein
MVGSWEVIWRSQARTGFEEITGYFLDTSLGLIGTWPTASGRSGPSITSEWEAVAPVAGVEVTNPPASSREACPKRSAPRKSSPPRSGKYPQRQPTSR